MGLDYQMLQKSPRLNLLGGSTPARVATLKNEMGT